jgi:pilus assembly protein CpaE
MLATNLALKLQTDDTPTLLVDADLKFGDVALFLNLPHNTSIADLAPYADELDSQIVSDVLTTHDNGLKVLAAPPTLEDAQSVSVEAMRKLLDYLLSMFTYVLVDTATGLDEHTEAIIEVADLLVTVMAPDMSSIKNTTKFCSLLQDSGIPKERICLVLNSVDRKDSISARQIADHLKMEVAAEIPFDRQTVMTSINRGDPLLQGGKTQPLARSLLGLIGTIKARLVAEPVEA